MLLPSQFGRYTLIERLAVGGMAEVFRAKIVSSHGFEKVIVIKRILPHLAADRTFVSMFIDEAKVTAQLTHPKIVQILDFGDVVGTVLHRARVHRRLRRAGVAARVRAEARAPAAAHRRLHRHGGARGAGLRAQRARHGGARDADRPSRHLTVQHLHLEARRREAGRLRHRARAGARVEDPGRNAQGQVRLHVAGAGDRRRPRRAERSVRGRHRAGRDVDGAPALHRAGRPRRAADGARRAHRSARQVLGRSAAHAGSHRAPRAGQGSGASATRPALSSATTSPTTCSRRASG